MKISVETNVKAPVAKVWHAYTTPECITQWNAASPDWHCPKATVDLRPGGTFSNRMEAKDGSFGFDFAGTYTEVVPLQRIGSEFGGRTALTTFTASPDGTQTTVHITFDPETVFPVEQQRQGWQSILDNFRRFTEQAP